MLHNLRLVARQLQQRLLLPTVAAKPLTTTQRYLAQRVPPPSSSGDSAPNQPLQFLGSRAADWRARDSRGAGDAEDMLWYQPYVVVASVACFMIYFCVLREESDIDQKLEGNIFDKVSGLEEVALIVNYNYNKEHGLDNRLVEQRLVELGVDLVALEQKRLGLTPQ